MKNRLVKSSPPGRQSVRPQPHSRISVKLGPFRGPLWHIRPLRTAQRCPAKPMQGGCPSAPAQAMSTQRAAAPRFQRRAHKRWRYLGMAPSPPEPAQRCAAKLWQGACPSVRTAEATTDIARALVLPSHRHIPTCRDLAGRFSCFVPSHLLSCPQRASLDLHQGATSLRVLKSWRATAGD